MFRKAAPHLIAVCLGLQGAMAVEPLVVQFPFDHRTSLPPWIERPAESSGQGLATIQIPILAPDARLDLAVTVYFYETDGGFLRALWSSAATGATLSSNLCEGVGIPNRRTLLLPAHMLMEEGVLTLQNDGPATTVFQMRFDWVTRDEMALGFGTAAPDLLLPDDRTVSAEEFLGAPPQMGTDRWRGDVVHAPVTDRVERIEDGLDFVVPLAEAPLQARVELRVAGLPVGGSLDLWVNGHFVGAVSVDIPPLGDSAHYRDGEGGWHLAGWRKAVATVPAEHLPPGDNFFQFIPVGVLPGDPVAVKEFALELRYPLAAAPPRAAEPSLFAPDPGELPHGMLGPQFRFLATEPGLK